MDNRHSLGGKLKSPAIIGGLLSTAILPFKKSLNCLGGADVNDMNMSGI